MADRMRRPATFVLILLTIEFLDEFVFGAREAAWPLIRDDLGLTYTQIGLLLAAPNIFSSLVEPALGILADVWKQRLLILGGGVFFALALIVVSSVHSFLPLLIASLLFYPASGAFVSLSQAVLMDSDPSRHENNMARWTFAGSLGVVAGPLALGAAVSVGLGWRGLFTLFAALTVVLILAILPFRFPKTTHSESPATFADGVRAALQALHRKEVIRWLTLLQFSDLLLDVLLAYLALYMVDVVHVTPQQAGIAVAVWSVVGLLGDFLLIPLLEHVPGLVYLRISALIELILYPAFLLIPGYLPKVIILGLLGFFNAGWYAILQGKLYTSMPGQSGTVTSVNNVFDLVASTIPFALGLIAQRFGLNVSLWLLLAGPLALLIGLPQRDEQPD